MTTDSAVPYDTRLARTALSSGIASLILFVLNFTPWFGTTVLYGSIIIGLVGVVCGALALRRRQPKSMSLTGLLLGGACALCGIGVIIFALIFVGAFTAI